MISTLMYYGVQGTPKSTAHKLGQVIFFMNGTVERIFMKRNRKKSKKIKIFFKITKNPLDKAVKKG